MALLALLAAEAFLAACTTSTPTASNTVSSPPSAGSSSAGTDVSARSSGKEALTAPSSTGGGMTASVPKLVVVNKTLRIETSDVDTAITRIRQMAARAGADIAQMQVATANDQPVYLVSPSSGQEVTPDSSTPLRAYVVVTVPTAKYAAFLDEAVRLGRVLYQSENTDDVTQQHIDLQARLGNLKAEQARLRQLFAKASNVRDMLAVESELTRVQGDIESLQGQITYLERQAARATVTLELTEPQPIVSPTGTDWGVKTALTDSVRAFVTTLNTLIVLLGPLVAIVIFVGLPVWLVVWLVVRWMRRRRARRAIVNVEVQEDTTEIGSADDEEAS